MNVLNKLKTIFLNNLILWIGVWLTLLATIRPLAIPDEGRYAGIARWMVISHDWLIPKINGIPFLQKPPLMYWIDATCMSIFGFNNLTARFAPLVASVLLLISTYYFLKKYTTISFTQKTILLLATNLLFFALSQYANTDLLVASGITIAIFSLADAVLSKSTISVYIGYIALGMATMAKGLIGILIPGMVFLPWIIAIKKTNTIKTILNPIAIILFLIITLPWIFKIELNHPHFFQYFFIDQQFNRFGKAVFNNQQPWFFYILILLFSILPTVLMFNFKGIVETMDAKLGRPIFLLVSWWLISVTLFFSIPSSKLIGYILVVIAPLMILVKSALPDEEILSSSWRKWTPILWLLLYSIIFISLNNFGHISEKYEKEQMDIVKLIGVILFFASILLFIIAKKRLMSTFSILIASNVIFLTSLPFVATQLDRKSNSKYCHFAHSMDKNSQLVFVNCYYYDIPYLINYQYPVAIAMDWTNIPFDSWADQLYDGIKFDSSIKSKLFWSMSDLKKRVLAGENLTLIADSNTKLDFLNNIKHKEIYSKYTVYFTSKASQ